MPRGIIFWVIMLVWLLFGAVVNFGSPGVLGGYQHAGGIAYTLLEFVLFALLGWQVYGPAIRS